MQTTITYNICKECIMDTSDPRIIFDNKGTCNHCKRYVSEKSLRLIDDSDQEQETQKLLNNIKKNGNSNYDCVIGVSGGVDSTFLAYYIKKKLGLRPIAIHVDNGWNSNLANENIEKTLKKLDIPLETTVLNWKEFSSLQKAFLESSTPDGEIPTDHAINAQLFKAAKKHKVKYIINGLNYRTEGMKVDDWAYGHADWTYIKNIYRRHNGGRLKYYPHFSIVDLALNLLVYRIKVVSILNYINYDKQSALDLIKNKLDYTEYESKHYESIYTKWFQGYYLIKKFGIDKRRGHLSDLIRSGQIKRDEALKTISKPALTEESIKENTSYILKKFRKDEGWLNELIKKPNLTYRNYKNQKKIIERLKLIYNHLRKYKLVSV